MSTATKQLQLCETKEKYLGATFLAYFVKYFSEPVCPTWLQVQQTVYCGQRQEESVQILQTEEMLQSWHEERR